jgi:hypothetical protein
MNLLPKEAAERLRTTVATLAYLRCTGGGPPYIKFGHRILYPLAELEKFENERLRTATSVRPAQTDGADSHR